VAQQRASNNKRSLSGGIQRQMGPDCPASSEIEFYLANAVEPLTMTKRLDKLRLLFGGSLLRHGTGGQDSKRNKREKGNLSSLNRSGSYDTKKLVPTPDQPASCFDDLANSSAVGILSQSFLEQPP